MLDVFSRHIVGRAMTDHLRTELVINALEVAIWNRRPAPGLIHHSDQGTQYTSLSFSQRCTSAGIRTSTGNVADCFDNAVTESFFATLETEPLDRHHFATRAQTKAACFDFIEAFYYPRRRHSSPGMLSPAEYERRNDQQPRRVYKTRATSVALSCWAGPVALDPRFCRHSNPAALASCAFAVGL